MKKLTPTFQGIVTCGRPIFDSPERFKTWMLSLEGKRFNLTIKKQSRVRSMSQNSYYWGVIVDMVAFECGFTPDEAHEALKWQFLQIKHAKLPTVKSTSNMSTAEFSDYIEEIKIWAATELNLRIPDPGEVA